MAPTLSVIPIFIMSKVIVSIAVVSPRLGAYPGLSRGYTRAGNGKRKTSLKLFSTVAEWTSQEQQTKRSQVCSPTRANF
jgi:hypothetical protein